MFLFVPENRHPVNGLFQMQKSGYDLFLHLNLGETEKRLYNRPEYRPIDPIVQLEAISKLGFLFKVKAG